MSHIYKYSRPISEDDYIRMDKGPVPSKIYDYVKSNPHTLSIIGKHLESTAVPDLDELSATDIEELKHSIIENKDLPPEVLSEISHGFAWNSASINGRISWCNIAKEAGAAEEQIQYIKDIDQFLKYIS